jgi:hypothetical protein
LPLLTVNQVPLPLQIDDYQAYGEQPAVWAVMAMVIGLFRWHHRLRGRGPDAAHKASN